MASVEVRNLTKEFTGHGHEGGVYAVNGIDLLIEDGEFMVLLGPSGCGKTTLLRMIGGLEAPTSGDILIGGRNVNGLPPRARQIAMVFQSYALYPHLNVYNNIAFPLKAAKLPKEEQQKQVHWAAGILGIDQLLKRKPRQLSGGQRQRVALARAIVRHPNVFLLDEPLSNLDAQRRASARDELQQFQRRIGTTTIYVTHDQVEAMGMGDRIAVIDHGQIRQVGTPEQIYDDPADTFVATFLGSPPMNLITRNGHIAGFRPEHIFPRSLAGGADDLVPFHFTMVRDEYLGAERLIYGEVDGIRTIARFPSTVHVDLAPGQSEAFVVYRRNLKHFDADSGLRRRGQD
jgi:multiple sugar transport system ATP-binding protein